MKRPGPRLPSAPTAAKTRAGFTVVEVLITLAILLVALRITVQTLASVNQLSPTNRETSIATQAAQNVLEELRAAPFETLFARYNDVPDDDPGVAGTAPGASFDVAGLQPIAGDPDGRVGRIEFPAIAGELREDMDLRDLGMPRDLNGDGVQDAFDHASDYSIIPVRVWIEWAGRSGNRTVQMCTALISL
jgi:prepilin-type N-terminal cleavage/methylation domain-containing protein